jgi:hypothetical protein
VAAGEVLAPGSCGVVAVGGALEPGGRTTVGAVESLLTSSCFRKGAESRRRHRVCGEVSLALSSGTAVGAAQAALSFCQAGQWSGEVTAVTSALSTGGRVSG